MLCWITDDHIVDMRTKEPVNESLVYEWWPNFRRSRLALHKSFGIHSNGLQSRLLATKEQHRIDSSD